MLVPLLLDLGIGTFVPPVNAVANALPWSGNVTVVPIRPLWVSVTPEDTIVVTPNAPPVGSFQ